MESAKNGLSNTIAQYRTSLGPGRYIIYLLCYCPIYDLGLECFHLHPTGTSAPPHFDSEMSWHHVRTCFARTTIWQAFVQAEDIVHRFVSCRIDLKYVVVNSCNSLSVWFFHASFFSTRRGVLPRIPAGSRTRPPAAGKRDAPSIQDPSSSCPLWSARGSRIRPSW